MEDLRIAQKIEEMIRYGYGAVRHFPKSERHVLSQELRHRMWRILQLAVTAGKRYHKKTTLQDLDIEIELMRRQLRLCQELGALPFKKYEVWSKHLDEVGRMLGAWIKSSRG